MSILAVPPFRPSSKYPDSDGKPMAENTLQFEWIVTIVTGLRHLFENDPNVFVAGDLFWYPVEGRPGIRMAPDAMVALGRPQGHRGSYRQWEEGGVAPQVVFEVLSPSNRRPEMARKRSFYNRYGVEEYYIVDPDPDAVQLSGYQRQRNRLVAISRMSGHISPRLGVKFEVDGGRIRIFCPDGKPFISADETAHREQLERQRADKEHERAERADNRAKRERERADRLQKELDKLRRLAAATPKPSDA